MKRTHRASLTLICMVANCILWLIWITNFLLLSTPYMPHNKVFDEQSPAYVFYGRAFPSEAYTSFVMQTVKAVERPSFILAIPVNYFFSSRGIFVDQLYWGVSVGGYYLITVFLFSFVQWYLVGRLADHVSRR